MQIPRILNLPICDAKKIVCSSWTGPKLAMMINRQLKINRNSMLGDLALAAKVTPGWLKNALAMELIGTSRGVAKQFYQFPDKYPFAQEKHDLIESRFADYIEFFSLFKDEQAVLEIISRAINAHHPETKFHQERVANLCSEIGAVLALTAKGKNNLALAARVHDIGKLAVPQRYLDGKHLSVKKLWIVQEGHLEVGSIFLSKIGFLRDVADKIVVFHHVFDKHLPGIFQRSLQKPEEEKLVQAILQVADQYDALTQPRAYRPEVLTSGEAIRMIISQNESLADKKIRAVAINALAQIIDSFNSVYNLNGFPGQRTV